MECIKPQYMPIILANMFSLHGKTKYLPLCSRWQPTSYLFLRFEASACSFSRVQMLRSLPPNLEQSIPQGTEKPLLSSFLSFCQATRWQVMKSKNKVLCFIPCNSSTRKRVFAFPRYSTNITTNGWKQWLSHYLP